MGQFDPGGDRVSQDHNAEDVIPLNGIVAQHFYHVSYEYLRLLKLVFLGLIIYFLGNLVPAQQTILSISVHLLTAFLVFPLSLMAIGFFNQRERKAFWGVLQRMASVVFQGHRS